MKKLLLSVFFLGVFINVNAQENYLEDVTEAVYNIFLPIELIQSERPDKKEIEQAIEQETAILTMQEAGKEFKNKAASIGLEDLKKKYNNKNTAHLYWENSNMISESQLIFEKEGSKTILDLRLEVDFRQTSEALEIAIYPSYRFIDKTGKEQIRVDVALPAAP